MAYRQLEHKPHRPNRTMQNLTTPSRFFIVNGSTLHVALPCWYYELHTPHEAFVHCRDNHDRWGWPDPRHPDRSCQDWEFEHDRSMRGYGYVEPHPHGHHHHRHPESKYLLDMDRLIPIHLRKEGYSDKVIVALDPTISGLTAEGWIDKKDDWIIHVYFDSKVNMEQFEPQRTRFSVILYNKNKYLDGKVSREVAVLSDITVLPIAEPSSYVEPH